MIQRGTAVKTSLLMGVGTNLVLLALSTNAVAESCDTILIALHQERHLSLVKQSQGKQTTEYRDGQNTSLSVSCALGKPNIAVSWDGPKPDQQFYDLVGRAGSLVSSQSATEIVKLSKQCRQHAIKDSGEVATIEQSGLAIECQAFVRDGGGTTISVFGE